MGDHDGPEHIQTPSLAKAGSEEFRFPEALRFLLSHRHRLGKCGGAGIEPAQPLQAEGF